MPVDWALVPNAARRKLLVADGSTIINVECLDELADFAGIKPRSRRSPRAMRGA
jgi:phosphoserine phosphatase